MGAELGDEGPQDVTPGAPQSARRGIGALSDIHSIVDQQIADAVARGEFDDLPGTGKPIEGLDAPHDPDWWLKEFIKREQISLPPASVQLRRDDAELDALLDSQGTEHDARAVVEDFNTRVLAARYTTMGGPPLITMPRDVEATMQGWHARRRQRHEAAEQAARAQPPASDARPRHPWWLFGRRTRE